MKTLREQIRKRSMLWTAILLPALLLMLSVQLHFHVHTPHHDENIAHNHEIASEAVLSNPYDSQHRSIAHHPDNDTFSVEISIDNFYKSFSKAVIVLSFILFLYLLIAPSQAHQLVKIRRSCNPLPIWKAALPPQLRAPPQ